MKIMGVSTASKQEKNTGQIQKDFSPKNIGILH
jgi:hypothetical protein